MPFFLLVTGLALLALCIAMQERSSWNLRGIIEALYVAIFPTLLAYTFWDFAVRRGNLRLVAPASYLTPLFSVGISSLYLGISLQPQQWLAGVLVVAGAIICRQAVRD